ncbi:alcohol dehydrogenase [Ahniella affigens]|uniref:enoyl-[acyl-carrier-protein] reductase n=1 Tax=Ahniella affigens TaxID=2021234 RepID=A0A2P1PYY7_9GAMM|nr:zinc-dependent alcohol dehydrogenase family protein [Ahniella affigens]AVQ00060.1 alcohol dehydrogenase [Ahniella affigens]
MKQARYSTRGPVPQDVIACETLDTPEPGPGQVRIKVLAAPINPSDVLTLTGEYGMLPPLPAVGGNEGVGVVEAHGEGVTQPAVGQTVLIPVGAGTWSTHVVADAAKLMPLPNGVDPIQLSMLVVNPPTAALMLSEFVDLQPGEWVIQNAANSAVGGYLIQIAKARGLKTANVVRRESAIADLADSGADVLIVDGPDLHKRVAEATGKAPIRLGIDAVGGQSTENLARCLAVGGTLVNYGAMSGEPCSISPASFVFRDITLKGFWLAQWFRKAAPAQQMAVYADLAKRIATGELHARVHATYPVEAIKDAVAAAASGGRNGKIVIVPTP